MSVFVFYVDAEGYVCGGTCDTSLRSSETRPLAGIPLVPPDAEAVAWPEGERWAHMTEEYGLLPETTHDKEAA